MKKRSKAMTNEVAKEKIGLKAVAASFLILFLAFVVFLGVLVYAGEGKGRLAGMAEKMIPFPAVVIGWNNFISIGEVNDNLASVQRFYENQDFSKVGVRVDFSTEDGKKRLRIREREILDKMIEDKVSEIVARQYGIKMTDEMVEQRINRELAKYGSEDTVRSNLERLYGWTIGDFKKKVVLPSMYQDELEKIFQKEDVSAVDAKKRIEEARAEIVSQKKDFGEVARNFSEGSSAKDGGDVGWIARSQMIPEVADVAASLQAGQISDIIESSLGYHIVRLDDVKTENGENLLKVSQILVRRKLFYQWLNEKKQKIGIRMLTKAYRWNNDRAEAEFSDKSMRDFQEKTLNESGNGDASVMF